MTYTPNKTSLTPSEFDNAVQGMQHLDSLNAFIPLEATFATTTVIAAKVVREKLEVVEATLRAVDPGDGGANSDTIILIKKNGTTIITLTLPDEADPATVIVGNPDTAAHAALAPGDVLTIETGDDIGDVMVGAGIEVRLAK